MWLSLQPRGSNSSWHQRNPLRGFWHSQNYFSVFTSQQGLVPAERHWTGSVSSWYCCKKMTLEILKSAFPLDTPVSMQMEKHCEAFLEWVIHSISVSLGSLIQVGLLFLPFPLSQPHIWFMNLVGAWGLQDCCLAARFDWSWPVG